AVVRIESAENVAREERELYLFNTVGPAMGTAIQRKEFFVSFASEIPRNDSFKTRSYINRVPMRAFFASVHLDFPPPKRTSKEPLAPLAANSNGRRFYEGCEDQHRKHKQLDSLLI